MTPEKLALMATETLIKFLVDEVRGRRGNSQEAIDAAEELARRDAFEAAQRAKPWLWRKIFGRK